MALPKALGRMTPAEYLAWERLQEGRHEFFDGVVIAMSGASLNHGRVCGNAFAALHNALKGGRCEAFINDQRVAVEAANSYFYPDLFVVCGGLQLQSGTHDTVVNPILVVEVLSPSTESRDRVRKFEAYRSVPSLHEYLLIAQDRPSVERYLRSEAGSWIFDQTVGLDRDLRMESLDLTLSMADLYARVEFPVGEVEA